MCCVSNTITRSPVMTWMMLPQWREHHLPCFVPGKDTVVASTAAEYENLVTPFGDQVPLWSSLFGNLPTTPLPSPASGFSDLYQKHGSKPFFLGQVNWEKQHKLFFAGDVRFDDVSYSHGVRQTLMLLFKDTPGTLALQWTGIFPAGSPDSQADHKIRSQELFGRMSTIAKHGEAFVGLVRFQAGQHGEGGWIWRVHGGFWQVNILPGTDRGWMGGALEAGPYAWLHPGHHHRPCPGSHTDVLLNSHMAMAMPLATLISM